MAKDRMKTVGGLGVGAMFGVILGGPLGAIMGAMIGGLLGYGIDD